MDYTAILLGLIGCLIGAIVALRLNQISRNVNDRLAKASVAMEIMRRRIVDLENPKTK